MQRFVQLGEKIINSKSTFIASPNLIITFTWRVMCTWYTLIVYTGVAHWSPRSSLQELPYANPTSLFWTRKTFLKLFVQHIAFHTAQDQHSSHLWLIYNNDFNTFYISVHWSSCLLQPVAVIYWLILKRTWLSLSLIVSVSQDHCNAGKPQQYLRLE